MTDEEFVFNSTVAERSVLKKSAQHKKNGPAVAKLGNKRMTAQEIREKHGACQAFNMDGFMNFNEFKAMPNDIQVEYVNKLQDKYDIGLLQISRYLFHVGDEGLQSHLRINGILNQCNPAKRRAKVGLVQFQKDIENYWREKKKKEAEEEARRKSILGKFVTYEEYQAFPFDEKIDYVNSLIEKYGVSINVVSSVLFGLNKDTLGAYFFSKKARDKIKNLESRCNKAEKRKLFEEAVNAWKGVADVKEEELPFVVEDVKENALVVKEEVVVVPDVIEYDEAPAQPEVIQVVREQEKKESVDSMVLKYSFVGDGSDLKRFKSLGKLFEGKMVKVNIEIVEV